MKVVVTGGAGFIWRQPLPSDASQRRHHRGLWLWDNLSNGRLSNLDESGRGPSLRAICATLPRSTKCLMAQPQWYTSGHWGRCLAPLRTPLPVTTTTPPDNAPSTRSSQASGRRPHHRGLVQLCLWSHQGTAQTRGVANETDEPLWRLEAGHRVVLPWPSSIHSTCPVLAFRFFNVFGPLQPADHVYAAAIPRFIDAALNGRPATVFGDGLQSRDFTYVDTVCATIERAVLEQTTCDIPGQPRLR